MHLKAKFGQGYHLIVSLRRGRTAEDLASLDSFIQQQVSRSAALVPSWKAENLRTYDLPKNDVKVSTIFEVMTTQMKEKHGIQEWSLNQTSLNEVFLRIAEESER